jgi:ketosteroid isomerase-like protein
MADENVEFVRTLFAETGGMPPDDFLALLPQMIPEVFDPEIEFVETPERIDARTYRGHDGVLDAFTRWFEQFEDYTVELVHIEGHGSRVYASVREQGRGRASGAEVSKPLYTVWTFRDDKVLRYEEFYDEAAARAVFEDG